MPPGSHAHNIGGPVLQQSAALLRANTQAEQNATRDAGSHVSGVGLPIAVLFLPHYSTLRCYSGVAKAL